MNTEPSNINLTRMTGRPNTLLIEGTFEELADELAHYIDEVKNGSDLQSKIAPLLESGQKDDALKKLVTGSTLLSTVPETGASLPVLRNFQNLLTIRILRIHCGVQPSHPSRPTVAEPRQVPSQDLPESLRVCQ